MIFISIRYLPQIGLNGRFQTLIALSENDHSTKIFPNFPIQSLKVEMTRLLVHQCEALNIQAAL